MEWAILAAPKSACEHIIVIFFPHVEELSKAFRLWSACNRHWIHGNGQMLLPQFWQQAVLYDRYITADR